VAVRLERFSQHFGEKLQHWTSARLGFSLSEKSRNYANGEWWGVISLLPQEGDADIECVPWFSNRTSYRFLRVVQIGAEICDVAARRTKKH
jgi:hypothetical protein